MEELELKTEKTQRAYKADKAKREDADQGKDARRHQLSNEEMTRRLTERMNREIMDMVRYNGTFTRFINAYLRAFFDYGEANQLEFWEVGVDGSQSWVSRNGKTVMLKPCRTEKNPNPATGERKSAGGIILPPGVRT